MTTKNEGKKAVELICGDLLKELTRLEKVAKGAFAKKCEESFKMMRAKIEDLESYMQMIDSSSAVERPASKKDNYFDVLRLVQNSCLNHDILFLRRQISYHVSSASNLPKVFADKDKILIALNNIIASCVKILPHRGQIDISLKQVEDRYGDNVEVSVVGKGRVISSQERSKIFGELFEIKEISDEAEILGLTVCKRIIQEFYGQFWIEFPKEDEIEISFRLPCDDISKLGGKISRHTFKYDISIPDFVTIKDKFGDTKSEGLLTQVEEYVRSLVRHPIDIVVAFANSGVVSAIYETPEGAAQSVAGRISQKLAEEEFRIGKKPIDISFKYKLSAIK